MTATRESTYKLGIDVGGTFTDLFLWPSTGNVESYKVLSTPSDPSEGVLNGLLHIAEKKGLDLATFAKQVATIVHGTTVTTNAVLTRKGAKTALLTTKGLRDALEMRRGIREEQYNNRYRNVSPIVPRYLRLPVGGRIDRDGNELSPIDENEVRQTVQKLRAEGIEAVAICLLNSFAQPRHEQVVARIVKEELPNVFVSVSSELLPVIRFYNRISTTALDAFCGPVLEKYLNNLTLRLATAGFSGVLLIMQSSGGVALPQVVRARPATTLLSGPAAGPCAGSAFANSAHKPSCLVVDMGGTSFDASLVRKGRIPLKTEGDIDRLRTALPMLDIVTIGAGGGSIGWIDSGGLLRMGPQSAGAQPGPACYGRGGHLPTCTDANVILGLLDPDTFAGGALTLSKENAERAIDQHLARPLGFSVEAAAIGMYRVINTNMAYGVREITVKRGLDPREFPLVIAGGAGGVHACEIARELSIDTLIVPAFASTLCAVGMLLTDLAHDFVRTFVCTLSEASLSQVLSLVEEMSQEGDRLLEKESVSVEKRRHEIFLDVRYAKQYHEVTVRVPKEALHHKDLSQIATPFHKEHNRLYGYDLVEQGTPIQLINVRVRSVGTSDIPTLPTVEFGPPDPSHARIGTRRAFVPEQSAFLPVPVFSGHKLLAGNQVSGPALVDRTDTTIYVTENYVATMDERGTAIIEKKGKLP
ncbi:MAG TPA: hydantoinase/oxoprolinase family protein [Pseudomonadota bacterium]|nr:hydantoinase/oxoprolinase family protein [Pseudomonadota bacterium]